jgi:hypothetical protein
MLTNEEARARVANGAAHLDKVKPRWFNLIDVGTLTLHDACGCIVGQLCGNRFSDGLRALGLNSGVDCGLDLSVLQLWDGHTSYDAYRRGQYQSLQDAWVEAIADRRLSQASATSDGGLRGDPVVRQPMIGVRA